MIFIPRSSLSILMAMKYVGSSTNTGVLLSNITLAVRWRPCVAPAVAIKLSLELNIGNVGQIIIESHHGNNGSDLNTKVDSCDSIV